MSRIRSHLSYANVMATLAVFIALGGGTTAVALSGSNTVFTDDIANDTQPASGGNPAGGLQAADLRPGSVGTSEVANDSLTGADVSNAETLGTAEIGEGGLSVLGDVTGTLANAQIAPGVVGTSEVAPDSLTNANVADTSSLGGPEINEASLEGVAHTSGLSTCCQIISDSVATGDAYSPSNPNTFVDLGSIELRSPTSDNSAGSGFRLCNSAAGVNISVYVGGAFGSPADTRSNPFVAGGGACISVDYNGSSTDAFGDFRLHLPNEGVVVFGNGLGTASAGGIRIFAIDS